MADSRNLPEIELIRRDEARPGRRPAHATSHDADQAPPVSGLLVGRIPTRRSRAYLWAVVWVVAATLLSFALFPVVDLANIIMVYLLAVVLVAARLGKGPAMIATVLGVASFVYFFVPNYYSFVLADLRFLPTFAVMLCVGSIVATLTARLRTEAQAARERERRTLALYQLSRGLAQVEDRASLASLVQGNVLDVFGCRGRILERCAGDELRPIAATDPPADTDFAAGARRVLQDREGGASTNGLDPDGRHLHLPLVVANSAVGVLTVELLRPDQFAAAPHRQLLEAFANNAAVALHRLVIADEARRTQHRIDEERLRNVLLSSMSHDLRTPLATITGAITTLIDSEEKLDAATRKDLMLAIREDAEGLNRQVRNLLDVTRIESGNVQIHREWHPLDEVVGCALVRMGAALAGRTVTTDVPAGLPLVAIDALLIEQVLVNLLENAVKHTPPRTPIAVAAMQQEKGVVIEVADRGPGVPPDERERIFAKFYRSQRGGTAGGTGLGLAICRGIVQLHGGRIWVEECDGGGASFRLELPRGDGQPPIAPKVNPASIPESLP